MAKTNTGNKGNEVLEDPSSLAEKLSQSEDFVKKNKNILLYVGLGVLLLAGGVFFYWYQLQEQNQEAQVSMIDGVYYWEQDSTKQALKSGLLEVADDYGSTDAGNLSKFYTGTAYLKQGKYDDAITYLKDFSSNDLLLQARVYSLIGDAYMEQKNFEDATAYYQKAVDYKPNQYYTPEYCMKAGLAYEQNKDYASAVKVYDKVINEYWQASELTDAKKYKARAEELAGQ
ncbi:MAG: tetratricopeptide repeat protein [Cytophagaceae bacterium]